MRDQNHSGAGLPLMVEATCLGRRAGSVSQGAMSLMRPAVGEKGGYDANP